MKEGWEVKKLGEVCEIQGGSTPKRTESLFWDNGTYPWFTIEDIHEQGREIRDTKQKVTKVAWERLRVFPVDTVLLCCTASVGEYAITRIPITSNQQFNGLVIKDRECLSPMYLMHYCATLKEKLLSLSGKTTIDFVSAGKVRELLIPLPPLPEQERIVSILDAEFAKIDAVKAGAEKSLQHAKDLFQAALKKELIAKRYRLLKDIYNIKTGKLNSNEAVEDGIYPFFTCSREIFSINHYAFDCEAILLAGNNASGDFNVKHYKGKFNAYQRTYVITAKDVDTNTRILYYVLIGYLENLKRMSLGANTKFLKLGMIENISIPYLSLPEQEQIVARLDTLNTHCKTLQTNYERTIALCDDMKQALLRKAFNGEL